MRPRYKFALLWCSHLGVLALGFVFAFATELRDRSSPRDTLGDYASMLLQFDYQPYVEVQRTRGGYVPYRDALLDFFPLRDLAMTNSQFQKVFGGERGHRELMHNYARLSRLESERGSAAEAERYLALALAECAKAKSETCTPDTPATSLRALERRRSGWQRDMTRRDKATDDNEWAYR